MKKHLILTLVTILAPGLGLAAQAQKAAGGGKPSSGVQSCRLSFNSYNPEGYSPDITVGGYIGDNTGIWYENKDKGLRCEMDTNTNNSFLDLNYFKYSGLRRQAWINLNFPIPPGDPLRINTGSEPQFGVQLTSDFFFTSGDLWSMPVGSAMTTGGQIMIPINGTYYSLVLGDKQDGHLGTGISVTHPDSTSWVLCAPPGSIGQLMVHTRSGSYKLVGFYYFGFTIEIDTI